MLTETSNVDRKTLCIFCYSQTCLLLKSFNDNSDQTKATESALRLKLDKDLKYCS